ncbi:unnamed protein product [Lepidochelys kempii]
MGHSAGKSEGSKADGNRTEKNLICSQVLEFPLPCQGPWHGRQRWIFCLWISPLLPAAFGFQLVNISCIKLPAHATDGAMKWIRRHRAAVINLHSRKPVRTQEYVKSQGQGAKLASQQLLRIRPNPKIQRERKRGKRERFCNGNAIHIPTYGDDGWHQRYSREQELTLPDSRCFWLLQSISLQ